MKQISITIFLSILYVFLPAQNACDGRYKDEIFSNVDVVTVNYSDVYYDNEHEMDIYTPYGDTVTNRPVIIYMHGGSFYLGDKAMVDCVDFCTSFAKRGYVAISVNYRLADMFSFLLSQDEQYRAVLRAVADAKAAVRFLRRDYANGDSYGIDPGTVFVSGYSAGGVIAIHQAYIDDLSDLPNNVQALASAIGGNLEGDAGNLGYSSNVQAVVSLAGGINDLNWIDSNDEPIVMAQGTNDNTVSYYCGPGLNNPAILNLCGSGEIQPKAQQAGVANDRLVFNGEGHNWAASGNSNSKFNQAIGFFVDFLYDYIPCSITNSFDVTLENTFSFYPNPTKRSIKISSHSSEELDIEISNLFGEIVYSNISVYSEEIINLDDLIPGIYFIKNKKSTEVRKLVIN